MFIERSAAKIRLVRTLFILVAVMPCAVLAGWAAFRHSAACREGLRLEAERLLGVSVAIDAVRHLRPGGFRCRGCTLRAAGGAELVVGEVEIEATPAEVRLRIPKLGCSPAAAGMLASIARGWLTEPVRFTRAWVIDVDRLTWDVPGGAGAARGPHVLRVECVAAGASRAVRVVRPAAGDAADEVRVIVHEPAPVAGADLADVHAQVAVPVPWPIVRALVGPSAAAGLPFGAAAMVSGTCAATARQPGWTGHGHGRIDGIDLATVGGRYRLAGEAAIDIERLEWADDRLGRLAARVTAGRGKVDQSLLDALVGVAGCRPGPAHRSLGGESIRPFDDLDAGVAIDGDGVTIAARPGRGGLFGHQGLSLVDEPAAAIPLDRLAWLLAPTPGPAVPVAAGSAWLLSVMPAGSAEPAAAAQERRAAEPRTGGRGSPGPRGDF